jgi:hypothetical protein
MAPEVPKTSDEATEAPLTVEERLKRAREMPASAESAKAFRAAFLDLTKQERAKAAKAREARNKTLVTQTEYQKRLEKLKQQTAQGKSDLDAAKKAHVSDPDTTAVVTTKTRGNKLFGTAFPTYLKKVADRRGIDFNNEDARNALVTEIISGAARPLDQGYDPNVPIYDAKKRAFDTDAMQVANIWSMATLGKQYTSPQELRENLPEDFKELVRTQDNLRRLRDEEIAENGSERIVGLLEGNTVAVDRTLDKNLNTQLARQQGHGAEHTLLLADLDDETKKALREAASIAPTKESMDAAGISPAKQRRLVAIHAMRESARPQDIPVGLMRTSDGTVAIDLGLAYDEFYRARFHAISEQQPEMSRDQVVDRAQREANSFVQRMVNLKAPVYHPDPEGAFRAYTKGEGLLGNIVDGAQILASVATLGIDELAGDYLDKMIKSAGATLLPSVRVAGTLKEATGEQVRAGEFGFVSRYLSDNAVTRGIDQFLRVNLISEGLSSAYAMALEEVLDKKGTFDGEIYDIAKRTLELYGTDEHFFRIASRDDDLGTMMFTLGRAMDPTIALGMREAPDEPDLLSNTLMAGGGLGLIAAMMFEPDALMALGPAAKLGQAGGRALKLAAGLDNVATIGRGFSNVEYDGARGLEAIQKLLADFEASPTDAMKETVQRKLEEFAYADPTGRQAVGIRAAELGALGKGVEAVAPGQVPSIARDIVASTKQAERVYQAEATQAADTIRSKDRALRNAPAQVQTLADDVLEHRQMLDLKQSIQNSVDASEQRVIALQNRLQALQNAPTTNIDARVVAALKERLAKVDLTDDAARVNILNDGSVIRVMQAAGVDPVEMLARSQALQRNGKARGIQRPKELKKFAEKLKDTLTVSLSRPIRDTISDTVADLQRKRTDAETKLRADRTALQQMTVNEATLTSRIYNTVQQFTLSSRNQAALARMGRRTAGPKVEELVRLLEKADKDLVEAAKGRAKALKQQARATAQLQTKGAEATDFLKNTLRNLVEIVEVSQSMGRAAGRVREEFGDVLKGVREEGVSPGARQTGEEVLRRAVPLQRMLDNMKATMTPAEYNVAVERMLKNQTFVQQLYRTPGAVGDLVRSQVTRRGVNSFIQNRIFDVELALAKSQGFWEEAKQFLSVQMGVLDIRTNAQLKRAATESRIYSRTLNGEVNEYLTYAPKRAGESNIDRAQRLYIEFMDGTDVITLRTEAKQEMTLSGRVGDTSPLEHSMDYLAGTARLYKAQGQADEALVALVRSFATDRIAREFVEGFEGEALSKFCDDFLTLVEADMEAAVLASKLPDLITKAWGSAGASISKNLANYRLMTQTLTLMSAESRMLKRVAGSVGDKTHLFSVAQARAINNFLEEGLAVRQGLPTAPVVGDLVVTNKSVQEFNEALGKSFVRAAPSDVKVADLVKVGSPEKVPARGFYEDPRASKTTKGDVEPQERGHFVGTPRDLAAERLVQGDEAVTAYRVTEIFEVGGEPMARLSDLSGNYVGTRPLGELTLRDPLLGFNDAIDGVLALGLSFTSGRSKNAITAAGTQVKRQYSKLVARSLDADGNVMYVPRDLSRDLYEALDGLQKDLVDAPVKGTVGGRIRELGIKALSLHKKAILFGLLIPRAAFGTNAIFGDATQMIIDLNDVPIGDVLRVSTFGAFGYIPGLRKPLQNSFDVLGKNRQLPGAMSSMSDPAVRAVLEGSNQLIAVRRGNTFVEEKASDILRKALDQGAGDNILTSDAMLALRRVKRDPVLGGLVRDYNRLLEIQMREATKAQRVGLFLNLYADQGMTAEKAGLRMRQALFNWDDAVGASEVAFLARHFLFYTFIKNAFAQSHRALFEGYTDNLDDYMKKFLGGRTKLQRLEVTSRLTGGFIPGLMQDDELTPEEAERLSYAKETPDYIIEQTLTSLQGLGKDQSRVTLGLTGRKVDGVAGILPKVTHIEFLNNYLDIANTVLGFTAVSALNVLEKPTGADLTDYEADFGAASQAILRYATDMANPFSGELLRGVASLAGVEDPQAGYGGASGQKVRLFEAAMLTHFGLGDGLELQDDGTLRINPDSTTGAIGKLLGSTPMTGVMRQFVLPEYTRFRLLDELNGGYVTKGSLPLFRFLSRSLPGVSPYDEVDEARIEAGPLAIEYTEAQRGWMAARIQAFSELFGIHRYAFFSGRATQEYRIKDAEQFMSTIISQSRKRAKEKKPIPTTLPKDESDE